MSDTPRITIVTPSRDQARFLEAAMRSVLDQGYANLEYMVVDGGSTDGSTDIIRRYESRLAWWRSAADEGPYAALNEAFDRSSGEILAWLNSDDMYCPWALRTVASIFAGRPEIEWLTTSSPIAWDSEGFCELFPIRGISRESFLDGRHLPWAARSLGAIQQESTFWRRSLWQRSGGQLRTRFSYAADFDLWSRFFQHAEVALVSSPLGGFRQHEAQRSHHRDEYLAEARRALEEARTAVGHRPRLARRLARLSPELAGYTAGFVVRAVGGGAPGRWDLRRRPYA
jgi:GT2 family glycosyltransferase